MSRYYAMDKVTGGVGDIVWHKQPLPGDLRYRYIVTVGNRKIGEIWPMGDGGWSAISYARGSDLRGLRSVDGFRTRWAATEYLLNVGVRPVDGGVQ